MLLKIIARINIHFAPIENKPTNRENAYISLKLENIINVRCQQQTTYQTRKEP